jgi:transcriptional regulator with XRE-family HTH domain
MKKIMGNNLKNLRKERGLSQEQVADYLSISQSAWARIENGQSQSWTIHLEKLCVLYKINIESLFIENAYASNSNPSINNHHIQINQILNKLIEQYETQINDLKHIIYDLKNK